MRFQLGQLVVATDRYRHTGHVTARRLIEWRECTSEGEVVDRAEEAYKIRWDRYVGRVPVNKGWHKQSGLNPTPAPGTTRLEMMFTLLMGENPDFELVTEDDDNCMLARAALLTIGTDREKEVFGP